MENDLMPLLPCPFCGEKAYYWHGRESGLWSVGCMNEQCFGYAGSHHKDLKEVVVEAWNTRHENCCSKPCNPACWKEVTDAD